MKSIFDDFRAGTARERLAIASDLFSIVGISIAAVITAVFTRSSPAGINDLAGISIFVLMSLAGLSLALACIIVGHTRLRQSLKESRVAFLVLGGYWCMILAALVYAAAYLYFFLISIHW